jgi:hypothetical protein
MSYEIVLKKIGKTNFMIVSDEEDQKVTIRCPLGHEYDEYLTNLETQINIGLICKICSKCDEYWKKLMEFKLRKSVK